MPGKIGRLLKMRVPLGDCGVITRPSFTRRQACIPRKIDVDSLAGTWIWVKKPNLMDEFRAPIFAVRVRP